MATYTYTKEPVEIDALEQEIGDQSFAVAVTGTTVIGDQVAIGFDGDLTTGEETTLATVVGDHTAPAGKPGQTKLDLKDGVGTPATVTDCASIYVDITDGDLKIKFGDGTIKTISTDT